MKGILIDNSSLMCTRPGVVIEALGEKVISYNWLITDVSGWDSIFARYDVLVKDDYVWAAGDVLKKIMAENRMATLNWGVLSAFPKDVMLETVLKRKLPYADRNYELFVNPIAPQDPDAKIEIDVSEITLLAIKADEEVIDELKKVFPKAQDLEKYNEKFGGVKKPYEEEEVAEESALQDDQPSEAKGGFFKRLFGRG